MNAGMPGSAGASGASGRPRRRPTTGARTRRGPVARTGPLGTAGEGDVLAGGDGVAHDGADDLAADLLELDPDLLDLVAVGVLGVGHHEDAVDEGGEGQAVGGVEGGG